MRGCIFFNRSFYRMGQALALDLQRRYDITDWSAYIYGETSYDLVKRSAEVKYSRYLVDDTLDEQAYEEVVDDAYLLEKEKQYGVPLMQLFTADRHFVHDWPKQFYIRYRPTLNHYQIKQHLQNRMRAIERFLNEAKPDFIIGVSVCALGSMVLFHEAKLRGIKFVNIDIARLGDRLMLKDVISGREPEVEARFHELQSGATSSRMKEAEAYLANFRSKLPRPFWANSFEQTTIRSPILFIKNFLRVCWDWATTKFPRVYSYNPLHYLRRNFLMAKNAYLPRRWDVLPIDEPYAFYPLHYDPELSTMVFAPYFTDQIWLIKQIAQSLPINWKLCVKEHPAMLGLRSPEYYRELKRIPNVVLLNPKYPAGEVIRGSSLVAVITSTSGLEAAFLNKPVIAFGSVFFDVLTGVYHASEMENLPSVIAHALTAPLPSEKELCNLIAAMMENSADVDGDRLLYHGGDIEMLSQDHSIHKLSDSIIKYVQASIA